jgi:hypothetical protein
MQLQSGLRSPLEIFLIGEHLQLWWDTMTRAPEKYKLVTSDFDF